MEMAFLICASWFSRGRHFDFSGEKWKKKEECGFENRALKWPYSGASSGQD